MPLDFFSAANDFRTRPRKMLSIPTMPSARPSLVRRPFGPRSEKSRPTITITIAMLVVVVPIAMLTFLSTDFRSRAHLSASLPTAPEWVRTSGVVTHSASSELGAEGAAAADPAPAHPAAVAAPAGNAPAMRTGDGNDDRPAIEHVPLAAAAPAVQKQELLQPASAHQQQHQQQQQQQPQQPLSAAQQPSLPQSGQHQLQPAPATGAQKPGAVQPASAAGATTSTGGQPAIARAGETAGTPPLSLPAGHPQAQLLQSIRERTQLSPRWPESADPDLRLLKSFGPAYSSIVVSHKLKVVYVPVFKVGTSSMMWHIAFLENNPHVVPMREKSSPGELQYLLHEMDTPAWRGRAFCHMEEKNVRSLLKDPSYLKFGFVRNPYDRTVSAYLDKVMSTPMDSWEYQEQMYGMYGNDEVKRAAANVTRPSFKEFLTAIHSVIKSPRTKSTNLQSPDAFETNRSRRDLHWRPQVELLHPDVIHLDFVGKFDNLVEDRQVVLDWMYQHTDRRMPKRGERIHSTNPADKVAVFKQLRENKDLRDLLLDAYKEDFDRFNFSREVPDGNTRL